eukprot:14877564-Alexandrium_andersonii.AAC.1
MLRCSYSVGAGGTGQWRWREVFTPCAGRAAIIVCPPLPRTTTYYGVLRRTTACYDVPTVYCDVLRRTTTYYAVLPRTTAYYD